MAAARGDPYAQHADGSLPAEALLTRPRDQFPLAMLAGGTLVYTEIDPKTGRDLWILSPDGKTPPLRVTPFNETAGQFSPDEGGRPRQLNVILNWSLQVDRPAADGRRDEPDP